MRVALFRRPQAGRPAFSPVFQVCRCAGMPKTPLAHGQSLLVQIQEESRTNKNAQSIPNGLVSSCQERRVEIIVFLSDIIDEEVAYSAPWAFRAPAKRVFSPHILSCCNTAHVILSP